MKYLIFIFFYFCFLDVVYCQVGIGTTSPNSSAKLEVNSSNKGFLLPRMSLLERNAIINPTAGLQIWCTNCAANGILQIFNGTNWVNSSNTITTELSVPSSPINPVTKILGNNTALVSFLPPTNNGGSKITSYNLTSTPIGITATSLSSPILISGLIPRQKYVFEIKAKNAIGSSIASNCSLSILDTFYWRLNLNTKESFEYNIGSRNDMKFQLKTNDIKRFEIDNLGQINFQNNNLTNYSVCIENKYKSYTIAPEDNGKIITFNSNIPLTLTIPIGLPVGFNVGILQVGLGQIEFIANNGVVLSNINNTFSTIDTYSIANIMSYALNELVLTGDLD